MADMKKIDLENWGRKSHYMWFSDFADPSLALNVRVDITEVLAYCKKNGASSFAVIMYVICEVINSNRALRLRVLDGDIYEIDRANVAYTIMVNDERFVNCRAKTGCGFAEFSRELERNKNKYADSNYVQAEYNDISVVDDIYCSCVPWVDFTSVTQPIPDKIPESKSIPRIVWGKYVEDADGRYRMTLNVTANHALVDGLDIANVINGIQAAFDNIAEFLKNK